MVEKRDTQEVGVLYCKCLRVNVGGVLLTPRCLLHVLLPIQTGAMVPIPGEEELRESGSNK